MEYEASPLVLILAIIGGPVEAKLRSLDMVRDVVLITHHNRMQLEIIESFYVEGNMVWRIKQHVSVVLLY